LTSYTLHNNLLDLLTLTAVLADLTFVLQLWLKKGLSFQSIKAALENPAKSLRAD